MAAISPPQSGGRFVEGEDGRPWGHKKNSSSQDSRQNFSYPNAYSQSPPSNSPQSPAFEALSSTYPDNHTTNSSFHFDESPHTPSEKVPSDRAVNRLDNSRSQYNEFGSANNYGEAMSRMPRQLRAPQYGNGGSARNRRNGQNSQTNAEYDKSQWIHRDKLTQIEIQEHIALGKEVPPELLRKMNDRQQNGQSRTYRPATSYDSPQEQPTEYKRQRVTSPSPDSDSYGEDEERFVPEDPRPPEEIAADSEQPPEIYQQNRLRSSSSRIPLSTTSPLPVPHDYLDRQKMIPRKRGNSSTYDEEGQIAYRGARSRSHSVGSQILLDDENDLGPNTPGSPSKARTPAKSGPTGRKGSNVRAASTSKNRAASSARNSPAARPITRDGRPTTAANRPEGDPPWLATMYKPDPRLPPDQQMLPTHAKRMMQEQWEREGRPGQAYDREFRPIAPYPDDAHLRPQHNEPPPELRPEDTQQGEWPQREKTPEPPRLQPSPQITQNPQRRQQSPTRSQHNGQQSNGEVHGGYSTIPKVQSTPVIGAQSPRAENREPFEMIEPLEAQDEKSGKKSGCGCCIIM